MSLIVKFSEIGLASILSSKSKKLFTLGVLIGVLSFMPKIQNYSVKTYKNFISRNKASYLRSIMQKVQSFWRLFVKNIFPMISMLIFIIMGFLLLTSKGFAGQALETAGNISFINVNVISFLSISLVLTFAVIGSIIFTLKYAGKYLPLAFKIISILSAMLLAYQGYQDFLKIFSWELPG